MKTQRFVHTRTRKTLDLPVLGHGFVFSPAPGREPSIWTLGALKALGFCMASNTPRWLPPLAQPRRTRPIERERRGVLTY